MSEKAKRIEWIDILKYICIMWVILNHLESRTDALTQFCAPFALSGFFFSSAYFYKDKDDFKTFFVKKVKGLLIPWFLLSVLNIVLSQILSFNEHDSFITEFLWNLVQIRGFHDGLWFVAALFMGYIPLYFFIHRFEKSDKGKKSRIILISVSFALAIISELYASYFPKDIYPWGSSDLPWHIQLVFIAMFWMVLGYLFKNYYEPKFDSDMCTRNTIICFTVFMIVRFVPFALGYEFKNEVLRILYEYISSFIGLPALIIASKLRKPNKYYLFIGQNTLLYFALHGKTYSVFQTLLKRFAGGFYESVLGNVISCSVFAIIFTIVISVVLIPPIMFINRFMPFLVGKKRTKNS